jgi:hypothetical protein
MDELLIPRHGAFEKQYIICPNCGSDLIGDDSFGSTNGHTPYFVFVCGKCKFENDYPICDHGFITHDNQHYSNWDENSQHCPCTGCEYYRTIKGVKNET